MILRPSNIQPPAPVYAGGGLPVISVTPSVWNFGNTPVGSPVSKVFTILNVGNAALEITLPITTDNAAFTVTVQPAVTSLAPGASTTFTVQATAASNSRPSGNISIVSNAASSPTLVAVEANIWLLFDDFSVNEAAPLASPRASTLIIGDAGNRLSIGSGLLENNVSAGAGYNNPHVYYPSQSNAVGKSIFGRTKWRSGAAGVSGAFGWIDLISDNVGVSTNRLLSFYTFTEPRVSDEGDNVTNRTIGAVTSAFDVVKTLDQIMTLRGTIGGGGYYLERRGHVWELIQVNEKVTATPLYPRFIPRGQSTVSADKLGVMGSVNMPATLQTADGLATVMSPTTAGAAGTMANCNGIVTWRFTAATGVTQELMFRRTDDSNTLILRADQTNSTLRLYKIVAGIETELTGGTTTQTWTNGTVYLVHIRAQGFWVETLVNGTNKNNNPDCDVQYEATGIKTVTAATTVKSYPSEPNFGEDIYPPNSRAVFVFGDSITSGQDDSVGTAGQNGYVRRFCDGIGYEEIRRAAFSGQKVHDVYTGKLLTARLATSVGIPDYIINQIGTNDRGLSAGESSFKTDYRYHLRTLHARWPNQHIYVIKNWTADVADTNYTANINVWIDAILAEPEFAAYASVCLNVRDLFFASPATYLNVDNIHPNNTGHQAIADALIAFFGAL